MALSEDKDGVAIRCDQCGARLVIAANTRQMSARRMPSGWMEMEEASHSCPLCSRAALNQLRKRF